MTISLPLAHAVSPFEVCAPAAWSAIAASVIAAILLIALWYRRVGKSALWTVAGIWAATIVVYFIGMRLYVNSKPPGYWCRNACIENLRIIDAGKEAATTVHPQPVTLPLIQ